MSPFAEDPEHFARWLRDQGTPQEDPASVVPGVGLFPRRAEFGRYVASLLHDAAAAEADL